MGSLLQETIEHFHDRTYEVALHSAGNPAPLTVSVRAFTPAQQTSLVVRCFDQNAFDREQYNWGYRYSLPLAIPQDDDVQLSSMGRKCLDYVKSIIDSDASIIRVVADDVSTVSHQLLSSIRRYRSSNTIVKKVS